MDNDDVVDILNDLIETSKDANTAFAPAPSAPTARP